MHPISGYVTLKAEAKGSVNRVELRMQRFSIDPITGVETPDTPLLLVKNCDPLFPVGILRCHYLAPWSGHHKMIEFEGTAVSWNGSKRVERYKFASGTYGLVDEDGNLKPVPIRAKGSTDEKLDIVIIPDPDLLNDWYITAYNPDGDWDGFRALLDDIIEDVYFSSNAIRHWRALYNFYYSPVAGHFDEDTCTFTLPDNLPALEVVADSMMYAHSQEMWDCKFADKASAENWYDKSMIHESGHALIGLRDEYAGANYGAYPPHTCMSNIFPSKAACQNEAPEIGLPASFCVLADSVFDIWRIDPAGATGSIMGSAQHKGWSAFGRASMRRILWRYDKCLDGDCMSPDPCDN